MQDQIVRNPQLLGELAGHFGEKETWWQEVLRLAVGLDTPDLFEPLLAKILELELLHRDPVLADDLLRDALAPVSRPLLEALGKGLQREEERYHSLRLLRSVPNWEVEGRVIVEALRKDADEQVRKLAMELVGTPAVRARKGMPEPGEEMLHEKSRQVLVFVPGGEYTLGIKRISPADQPVHRVVLNPFWIGKYPVTNEQYSKLLAANPGVDKPGSWEDKKFNHPRQPVVGVSWVEAKAYCEWADLRLPSEAQWEAAARGTDQRRYPWGNDEPTPAHANFDGREGRTTAVGAFLLGGGPFGTLDQAGNVWEWCEDIWEPVGFWMRLAVQGDTARSLRGGAWSFPAQNLAAAFRNWSSALYRHLSIGFRCLLPFRPEHEP